jgi:hypothetical protein
MRWRVACCWTPYWATRLLCAEEGFVVALTAVEPADADEGVV